jgi:DNA ligase-1
MLLLELVNTSLAVAQTPKRGEKSELIARVLERVVTESAHDEAARHRATSLCVAYLSGQVRQQRLGVGPQTVFGLVEHPAAARGVLTLEAVDDVLDRLANTSGAGGTKLKKTLLGNLFALATAEEQRFLTGLLTGELRQGAVEGVLLDAVVRATGLPLTKMRRALLVRGDFVEVATTALTLGAAGLAAFSLTLFQPLSPMLAQPGEGVEEALAGGIMQAEFKLDGARIQVHKDGDEVRVYSRQLNDVTGAVPEVVSIVSGLPAAQLILDGEAIAMTLEGKPFPFQDTMRRFGRKKTTPEALQKSLPLSCFFFDCLHIDGTDVFADPYQSRQVVLDDVARAYRVEHRLVNTPQEVDDMFQRALSAGHEGLVLKDTTSAYEPGRRGSSWLKLKPVHTLDLVVLAAEWGSGRRKGTLSNLHLGAGSGDGFVMLGKTFKGLTDELLAFQTRELLLRETHRDQYTVYVKPELVVEIAFDGVQRSSQYPGGVALRFARVKRYRPDKLASDADTIEEVLAFAPGGSMSASS